MQTIWRQESSWKTELAGTWASSKSWGGGLGEVSSYKGSWYWPSPPRKMEYGQRPKEWPCHCNGKCVLEALCIGSGNFSCSCPGSLGPGKALTHLDLSPLGPTVLASSWLPGPLRTCWLNGVFGHFSIGWPLRKNFIFFPFCSAYERVPGAFSKCLLRRFCVPGSVLGCGEKGMDEAGTPATDCSITTEVLWAQRGANDSALRETKEVFLEEKLWNTSLREWLKLTK